MRLCKISKSKLNYSISKNFKSKLGVDSLALWHCTNGKRIIASNPIGKAVNFSITNDAHIHLDRKMKTRSVSFCFYSLDYWGSLNNLDCCAEVWDRAEVQVLVECFSHALLTVKLFRCSFFLMIGIIIFFNFAEGKWRRRDNELNPFEGSGALKQFFVLSIFF